MKATQLLKEQHRKVEKLFAEIEGGDSDALQELANNLVGHMAIEQEIFYPAVREVKSDLISESFEEHAVAELALKRALELDSEEEQFDARVSVLKELIAHHVEEEEGQLFPAVESKLSADILEDLGRQMQERFEEVVAEGHEAALPEGFEETSADQALDEADAEQDEEAEGDGARARGAESDDEEDEEDGVESLSKNEGEDEDTLDTRPKTAARPPAKTSSHKASSKTSKHASRSHR